LCQIRGIRVVAAKPAEIGEDPSVEAVYQFGRGGQISRSCALDQDLSIVAHGLFDG
jgi:hypothetical protein